MAEVITRLNETATSHAGYRRAAVRPGSSGEIEL